MEIKNWKILLLTIVTFLVINSCFAAPQVIDKIAAIVNNDVILESDINLLIRLIKLSTNQANQNLIENNLGFRYQLLKRLILDQIVLQVGYEKGIQITDKQLDQAIDNIAKQNKITTNQMLKYLAYNGITYSKYRNQIRKEIITSEVRNREVSNRIVILPQEVESLAKTISSQNSSDTELKLSYIIVPLPKKPTSNQIIEAENQARWIFHQVNNNNHLDQLIPKHFFNQNIINKWQACLVRLHELPFVLAQALSTAKKGDIIGPIRSDLGFYVLKVNDLHDQKQSIFVTKVHIRHILLKTLPTMNEYQTRANLQRIANDIKSGKLSFANAAKKFSHDLDSANQGGDLGWVEADTYDSELRNTLMKLNRYQISNPVHSSLGWHLIEILDVHKVDKTDVIQRDRAYHILFNRKFFEESVKWIQEKRASAYVKIMSN